MPAVLLIQMCQADLRLRYKLTNSTQSPSIPRPEGYQYQNIVSAMQLSRNPFKFKEIYVRHICSFTFYSQSFSMVYVQVTICNAINRAYIDPCVPWQYQPPEKLSRIMWIVSP